MIRKLTLALLACLTLSFVLLGSAQAATAPPTGTDPFHTACSVPGSSASTVCTPNQGADPLVGPNGLINKITHVVAIGAGIAAVIIMMIGGLMFITSSGDAAGVKNAKNTILYAFVGLIVIIAAQTIIIFIVNRL